MSNKKNDFGIRLKEYKASLAARLEIRKYGRFVPCGAHMNEDFFEGVLNLRIQENDLCMDFSAITMYFHSFIS